MTHTNISKSDHTKSGYGSLYLFMRWVSRTSNTNKYSAHSTLGFLVEEGKNHSKS